MGRGASGGPGLTSCCSLVFQIDSTGAGAEDIAIAAAVCYSRRLKHCGKIASGFPPVELEDHFIIDVALRGFF